MIVYIDGHPTVTCDLCYTRVELERADEEGWVRVKAGGNFLDYCPEEQVPPVPHTLESYKPIIEAERRL